MANDRKTPVDPARPGRPKPPPLPGRVVEQGPKPTGMPPGLRKPTAPGIPQTHAKPPERHQEARLVPDEPVVIEVPNRPIAPPSRQLVASPGSQPDSDRPEDLIRYRIKVAERDISDLDDRADRIEGKVDGVTAKLDQVSREHGTQLINFGSKLDEYAKAELGKKAIFGFLTALITTFGAVAGTYLMKDKPQPATQTVHTEFDRRLSLCKDYEDIEKRVKCGAMTGADAAAVPPRR